jgi:hypothetical protein
MRDQVDDKIRAGTSTSAILSWLKEQGHHWTFSYDLRNRKDFLKRVSLKGSSPLNALRDEIKKRGVISKATGPVLVDARTQEIRHLFIAYETTFGFRGRDIDLLVFDGTFNTNVYGMPMCQFVGKLFYYLTVRLILIPVVCLDIIFISHNCSLWQR